MNSTSDIYFDAEFHGAVSELHSTESSQKQVAKGSVENRSHDRKVDNLPGAMTSFSFEKQNGSTKPSSEKKADVPQMKQLVPFFKLFKYADRIDILLMFLGTGMAIVDGIMWPIIAFIQSKLLNSFASLGSHSPKHGYDDICRVSNSFFSTLTNSTKKVNNCNLYGDCLLYE